MLIKGTGTSSPAGIEIHDQSATGRLYIQASNTGAVIATLGNNSLQLGTNSNVGRIQITGGGNVGIGGSPSHLFDVNGATRIVNSLGVGTAPSGTAGEIRAANEITAFYSDERLKNFSGNITNALNKVMSLNGYYYTENELAKSFGFNKEERQVGVSAQQVQAVLPEVIRIAPFVFSEVNTEGVEYLTVQYEKLVPLLIEAIKELKAELDEIKKNGNS
jgi:hypothetical protein